MLRAGLIFLLALGLVACSAEADTETTVTEHHLEGARDVFDAEEHIATPSHVHVADDGRLYVSDGANHRVLVLSSRGELLHTIGREGEGPGEFSEPMHIVATEDSIFIGDIRPNRVHVFSPNGDHYRTQRIDEDINIWSRDFTPDGHFVIGKSGIDDALARWRTPDGEWMNIGDPVAPTTGYWSLTEARDQIAEGVVPDDFRNRTLLLIDNERTLWLFQQTEGVLQRYDSEGILINEVLLDEPEMEHILESYFQTALEDERPNFIPALRYLADAGATDRRLWLLLNTPDEDPAVVLLLSKDGVTEHRLVIPEASGASHLALSPDGSAAYFTIRDEARLLAVDLPEELVGR